MRGMVTPAELTQARRDHDNANRRRADIIRQALTEGMPQKDVAAAMGYSRETIRRIVKTAREEPTT